MSNPSNFAAMTDNPDCLDNS